MKKSVLFLTAAMILSTAGWADYYLLWNGQDVDNVTADVLSVHNVEIWSDDGIVHDVNDAFWTGQKVVHARGFSNGGNCDWSDSQAYPAAGSGATTTELSPPNQWALACFPKTGTSPGKWFSGDLLLTETGEISLELGYYEAGPPNIWHVQDTIIIQVQEGGQQAPDGLIAQWEGDFADIQDGNKVAALYDQSGNGADMRDRRWYDNDANDFRPVIVPDALNGHDVVQFDGGQFLQYSKTDGSGETDWTDAQNYTWFIVANDLWPDSWPAGTTKENVFSVCYDDVSSAAGDQPGYLLAWGSYITYGLWNDTDHWTRTFASAVDDLGFADERVQRWGVDPAPGQSGWRVITGVWDADDENSVLMEGEIDMYSDYNKGSDQPPYYYDAPSTDYLSGWVGAYLGASSHYALTTAPRFYNGQIAEVRIYRNSLNTTQILTEVKNLRCKYGLENCEPDPCADMDDLRILAENWLNQYDFVDFADLAQIWSGGICE